MLRTTFTLIALFSLIQTNTVFACSEDGRTGFLPENNLKISAFDKEVSTIDEAKFNAIIDRVEKVYAPIVAEKGGKLEVERNWKDGTVNAYAKRSGKTWTVAMFGGLARHPAITDDGFAVVVCHEVGHHIGGAPKKGGTFGGSSWASNEGQADYFATLKCMRRVFGMDDNQVILANAKIPGIVTEMCAKQFGTLAESKMCERSGLAGLSLANLFQALRKDPKPPAFDTPDPAVVNRTFHDHPATQCRMDTYYAGTICQKSFSENVDEKDPTIGTCAQERNDKVGVRPLCWYKPKA